MAGLAAPLEPLLLDELLLDELEALLLDELLLEELLLDEDEGDDADGVDGDGMEGEGIDGGWVGVLADGQPVRHSAVVSMRLIVAVRAIATRCLLVFKVVSLIPVPASPRHRRTTPYLPW